MTSPVTNGNVAASYGAGHHTVMIALCGSTTATHRYEDDDAWVTRSHVCATNASP